MKDVDEMYSLMESALAPFRSVNKEASQKNRLIIEKDSVEQYIGDKRYFTVLAESGMEIAGWVAGSKNNYILSEHKCVLGNFYLEEILVKESFRRMEIGRTLLQTVEGYHSGNIVVDTPLINDGAIRFYEKIGFIRQKNMPEEFSRDWVRMVKERVASQ